MRGVSAKHRGRSFVVSQRFREYRQGWIPDWLRRDLVKSLSAEEEKSIRMILDGLIGLTDVTADGKSERLVSNALKSTQDSIVASILGGNLSVSIPRRLREAVSQQRSQPWLGLAGAAVLSLSVFLAARKIRARQAAGDGS